MLQYHECKFVIMYEINEIPIAPLLKGMFNCSIIYLIFNISIYLFQSDVCLCLSIDILLLYCIFVIIYENNEIPSPPVKDIFIQPFQLNIYLSIYILYFDICMSIYLFNILYCIFVIIYENNEIPSPPLKGMSIYPFKFNICQ